MKDSTAEQVWGWLMEHANGCGHCAGVLAAIESEGLHDGEAMERLCLAGRPMAYQYVRKMRRQQRAQS